MLATLERPNIIVGYDNGNKGYYKVFKGGNKNKNKNQVVSIHKDKNGDFVYTAMPSDKGSNYFIKQINKGNILYKKAAGTQKNAAVNNIITDIQEDFNPMFKNNETHNNKEQDMAPLDELKKLITKVENDKGEDMDKEKAKNEKVDKRKLIDEVAGMMKSAGADDELIRTAIGKMEKIAYDKSEAGTADNACEEVKNKITKSLTLNQEQLKKYSNLI